jgi:hypothetical protein
MNKRKAKDNGGREVGKKTCRYLWALGRTLDYKLWVRQEAIDTFQQRRDLSGHVPQLLYGEGRNGDGREGSYTDARRKITVA